MARASITSTTFHRQLRKHHLPATARGTPSSPAPFFRPFSIVHRTRLCALGGACLPLTSTRSALGSLSSCLTARCHARAAAPYAVRGAARFRAQLNKQGGMLLLPCFSLPACHASAFSHHSYTPASHPTHAALRFATCCTSPCHCPSSSIHAVPFLCLLTCTACCCLHAFLTLSCTTLCLPHTPHTLLPQRARVPQFLHGYFPALPPACPHAPPHTHTLHPPHAAPLAPHCYARYTAKRVPRCRLLPDFSATAREHIPSPHRTPPRRPRLVTAFTCLTAYLSWYTTHLPFTRGAPQPPLPDIGMQKRDRTVSWDVLPTHAHATRGLSLPSYHSCVAGVTGGLPIVLPPHTYLQDASHSILTWHWHKTAC